MLSTSWGTSILNSRYSSTSTAAQVRKMLAARSQPLWIRMALPRFRARASRQRRMARSRKFTMGARR